MHNILTLNQLRVGETAKIVGFDSADKAYRHKLLVMGLTSGVELTLKRVAPLGCPIEIHVRGSALMLRKHEASKVRVKRIPHE